MLKTEVRAGAYYDSVVLMQLQRALAAQPGVLAAGVVMGTPANKELLAQSELFSPEVDRAAADDLVIVVRGDEAVRLETALASVDSFLSSRRTSNVDEDYRPKTLATAAQFLPAAHWVLISTPGRYAAEVAREALALNKNVFLYSDNVALTDEVALKHSAAQRGLLVMGPDCGTAIVNGVGLGFANRVRRGSIGILGASGTGLQSVTARIHQLGGGISHALGTGGRDLSEQVGAITARQALDLLSRDPATRVIVLISKPPSPAVADELLRQARVAGKPVVVDFIGYHTDEAQQANLYFAKTLDAAAELAVELAQIIAEEEGEVENLQGDGEDVPITGRYLRGLFSGGTLAYEALLLLQDYLPAVYSNAPLEKRFQLEKATVNREHTIIDLGEDEFTVGRLHPMLDNELRIQRLQQEAADPETALILLDVVLGDGAHPDPASELAPAIAEALIQAEEAGRELIIVAIVVGTDLDPQGLEEQIEQLAEAGAHVELSTEAAIRWVGPYLQALNRPNDFVPVPLSVLHAPVSAINVGLESFSQSLAAQGVTVAQVEWRPPAGGNERLASILARMKRTPP